jgi:Protein of unknown function (DUF2786)
LEHDIMAHVETTGEKLDAMMRKVQALIARADHPNTPEAEAETARTMAEAIMFKYRIEESMLGTNERARMGIKPERRDWAVATSKSEFYNHMYWLAGDCVSHVDAMMTYRWGKHPVTNDGHWLIAETYGYESDLRYAEMLFTACQITFSARLEPKVDPSLSDAENVYNLRMAGIERLRIAVLMGWVTKDDAATAHPGRHSWISPSEQKAASARCAPHAHRVTRIFKAEAARRGDDTSGLLGKGNSVATYRKSFADAFVSQIRTRLYRLRADHAADSAGTLVLKSRKDDVREFYYQHHPEDRPTNNVTYTFEECPRCKAASSGHCRKHPAGRKPKSQSWSGAGARAGNSAGMRVDLTGGDSPTPRTNNAERKSIN